MTSRYRTLVGFIVALLGATALILVTPNPAPAQPPCKALCYLEHADRIADCRLDPADKRGRFNRSTQQRLPVYQLAWRSPASCVGVS